MIHAISIDLRPVPQRDSTRGKYGSYRTKAQVDMERKFADSISKASNISIDGPVFVFYDLRFRVPKSATQAKRHDLLFGKTLRKEVPDRVNCEDFLDNRLKESIIDDDALIISGGSVKRWAVNDGVTVYIAQAHNLDSASIFYNAVWRDILCFQKDPYKPLSSCRLLSFA
jgi:hypothetical protein